MNPKPPSLDLHSWSLLLFLSTLWGGSYLFIGIAVRELTPLAIVLARVVLAAAALLALHAVRIGGLPLDRRSVTAFAVMAFINNVIPFMLIVTGQTMIAGGLASVINATAPMFGALFMVLAGEERLIPRKAVALLAGLAGVAVLKGTDFSGLGSQTVGILCCLGAAASYGLAGLWAKKRLTGFPSLTLATGQLTCSAIMMAILAFGFGHPAELLHASALSWAALAGLALLATSLAYLVFFAIVARAGPANVLLVTMLIPVSAILFGHFFLGEDLSLRELAGALIIGAALVLFDGRALARRSKAPLGAA